MIRPLETRETGIILDIINAAARAYHGVIPADCWHEPYMSLAELERELKAGVNFRGEEAGGRVVGVMGRQDLGAVTLIRHAYVHPDRQRSRGGGASSGQSPRRGCGAGVGGHLDCSPLGGTLLRKKRLHPDLPPGNGTPAPDLLDHLRPADRDFGGVGKRSIAAPLKSNG